MDVTVGSISIAELEVQSFEYEAKYVEPHGDFYWGLPDQTA
jgi:hypothetical protein